MQNLKVLPCLIGSCVCFWILFGIVGLAVSLVSLDQGRYALKLDWSTQKIDDVVVTDPGMKNVGFGNMLLEFPSIYQNMHFSKTKTGNCNPGNEGAGDCESVYRHPIHARSRDGLEMSVSVSFQWKLEPQALKPLYKILGHDLYRDEFVRFARAAIVSSCSKFTADMFFSNRTQITGEMLDTVRDFFNKPENDLQVQVTGLQLAEVDLPNQFDDEIKATQEQIQDLEVAKAEREEQRISLQREIMEATQKVMEITENARGEADRILQENKATVDQMVNNARRQAESQALILQLFENDADPFARLFDQMKIRALSAHSGHSLLLGV